MTKSEEPRRVVECRNCGTLLRVPAGSEPQGDERIEVLCVQDGCDRTYSYDIDDTFVPSDLENALISMRDKGITLTDLLLGERKQD